jgi:hypothetical protein
MPRLIIQGTVVNLADSGSSPNWSQGLIDSIVALTDAVNSISGTYDVAPQIQNIDANNSSTNVNISNLVFPVAEVRSATIFYSVYRITENSGPSDGQEKAEGGTLTIVYNAANPVSTKWEIARERVGSANITFSISDIGQVQFSTTALTGINHIGTLSFRAFAVLNS